MKKQKTEIHFGATRIVLLHKEKAIKLAKIRPLRLVSKIFSMLCKRNKIEKIKEEYGLNLFKALFNFTFVGFWANRNEYFYTKFSKDNRIARVNKIYLFGLIITQNRGKPVDEAQLISDNPLSLEIRDCSDFKESRQYCRFQNKILLVDYGNSLSCEILKNSQKMTFD